MVWSPCTPRRTRSTTSSRPSATSTPARSAGAPSSCPERHRSPLRTKESAVKNYFGVAVSIGVLAGIWTQLSVTLGLVTWIAFVIWAGFYAAGAHRDGFVRVLASALSGVVYGWLAVWF